MYFLNLLPLFTTAVGIFFLYKLRFFFIAHPIKTVGKMKKAVADRESRRALSLALAGTLGVGNIVGVAYGISVGGCGALFWIFVSGIFSSVIKYAESTLARDKKRHGVGGMMYVLCVSFRRVGKVLGVVYAVLCLFLSFTMGAALQSQSAVIALGKMFEIPGYVLAFFFTFLIIPIILGKSEKIEKATSLIIPLSTIIYIILALTVILLNLGQLLPTLVRVVSEAFNFKSFGGGVLSFGAVRAMREGYARGLLSNEAGAGTSAMAQSRSNLEPCEVGLLGILEVFFDTSLLCILTGLAVLLSGVQLSGVGGMDIVLSAVSSIPLGEALITVLIFTFAYSTVVCWYYYGCECVRFLFGEAKSVLYTVLFIYSVYIGFALPSALLIYLSDTLLFGMSILTMLALIKNSERVVFLSEQYGLLKKSDIRERCKSRIGK